MGCLHIPHVCGGLNSAPFALIKPPTWRYTLPVWTFLENEIVLFRQKKKGNHFFFVGSAWPLKRSSLKAMTALQSKRGGGLQFKMFLVCVLSRSRWILIQIMSGLRNKIGRWRQMIWMTWRKQVETGRHKTFPNRIFVPLWGAEEKVRIVAEETNGRLA